jgi:capsular exopolysaccharide synthesis family protein
MNVQNLSEDQSALAEPPTSTSQPTATQSAIARTTALATREQPPSPPAGKKTAMDLLAMIWRRRRIVAAVTGGCLLIALIWALVSPKIYRSEARLFVQGGGVKSGAEANKPGASGSSLHSQAELIKSTTVMAMVLASPELDEMKTFADSRYNTLKENLNAVVGKDNDIITVSFESPYPREARKVLDVVIASYSSFHTKEKKARFAELEKWREKTQAELDKKQKELVDYKRAHSTMSMAGEKGNIVVQRLERLEQALTDAHVETVNAKSALDSAKATMDKPERLRKLVEALRTTGNGAGVSPEEQSLRKQLLAMEEQLDNLRRRYLPEHPAVRAAEQTSASLRARLGQVDRDLAEGHVMRLEQELAKARNKERELQQAYEDQRKVATDLSAKMAEAEAMESELKRHATSVDKANQQIIELTANDTGVPTIQVFDEPNLPATPIRPVRSAIILQGLLIGLLLGCAAALVRDFTDQSLRSSADITTALDAPILGALPHMPGATNPMASGRKVDLEPAGDVAETYRTIRTAVFFGTPDRESRTILVTSPAEREGRSTFAANLAISMAQAGKKVILVDADFRNPVQHRVFECRGTIGLSSVLTSGETLERTIQASGVAGLDVLTSGPVPSNPAEILNSQLFAEVLEELSVRYDHVVIDSPPVTDFADARVLAAICSVTILVLRAQTSTRRGVARSRHALEAVGAQLLGVVVNDVPSSGGMGGNDFGESGGYRRRQPSGLDLGDISGRNTGVVPAESFLDLRRK